MREVVKLYFDESTWRSTGWLLALERGYGVGCMVAAERVLCCIYGMFVHRIGTMHSDSKDRCVGKDYVTEVLFGKCYVLYHERPLYLVAPRAVSHSIQARAFCH